MWKSECVALAFYRGFGRIGVVSVLWSFLVEWSFGTPVVGGVEYDKTAWSHNTEICPMLVLFLVIRDQYGIANEDIDDLVVGVVKNW